MLIKGKFWLCWRLMLDGGVFHSSSKGEELTGAILS